MGAHPELTEIAFRLLMAVFAGCLVGIERFQRGHPAGMRTFALVSLTSALLTASLGVGPYGALMGTDLNGGSRVVQGILAGIGFIGAGVIVRDNMSVRGLTSAASIWAVSGIGILIGTGEIFIGFIGALFVVFILISFRYLDTFVPARSYAVVHAKFAKNSPPDEDAFRQRLENYGFEVASISFKGAKSGALQVKASVWASGRHAAEARGKLAIDFLKDTSVSEFAVEPTSG